MPRGVQALLVGVGGSALPLTHTLELVPETIYKPWKTKVVAQATQQDFIDRVKQQRPLLMVLGWKSQMGCQQGGFCEGPLPASQGPLLSASSDGGMWVPV